MNRQTKLCIVTALVSIFVFGEAAHAQQTPYPKPTELPNPYRLVEGWPSLPKTMNGGKWGEVIRVHVDEKGNIWVFHRSFESADFGIRSVRQSSKEFWRGTVCLSPRLHGRRKWEPMGN